MERIKTTDREFSICRPTPMPLTTFCCNISYSLSELFSQMGTAMSIESNDPSVSGNGTTIKPHILELRIHGVRDTPPWEILGVDQGDAIKVAGDNLGSFWIPKKPTNSDRPPPKIGSEVPKNVHREAYSWGSMARFAPVPGANLLGKSASVIRRVGWLMMLPFALCNAAYWMRSLKGEHDSKSGARRVAGKGWSDANGGGIVRVFGLFLTLLLVASATAASVDLIGNKCVRTGQICSTLPGLFNGLASLDQLRRNVILALLPLIVLAVIYTLSVLGRVRFSANVAAHPKTGFLPAGTTASTETTTPKAPLLKTPGFWYSPMMPRATELLHLSGAGALITAMLAWDALYSSIPGCRNMSTFFGPQCAGGLIPVSAAGTNAAQNLSAIAARPDSFIALLVAVALLIAVACRIVATVTGNADIADPKSSTGTTANPAWLRQLRWAWCLLAAVVTLGLVNAGFLWLHPEAASLTSATTPQNATFLGVFWTPSLLVLAMVGMSIAGLGWRRGAGTTASLFFFGGAAGCFIGGCLVMKMDSNHRGPVAVELFVAALLLVAGLGLHILRKRSGNLHEHEGWNGMGPGVIMIVALGVALALSSVLVVGTANFLNGKLTLTGGTAAPVKWRNVNAESLLAASSAPKVTEVPIYDQFGLALLVTVTVVGLILAMAICRQIWGELFLLSTPEPTSMPTDGTSAGEYPGGHPSKSNSPLGNVARLVLNGRRTAGLLHRVEHSLGWLAGTFLAGLLGTLAWSLIQPSIPIDETATADLWTQQTSSLVLGLVALALVGGIVLSTASSEVRPAGVLWDLVCFLPNAAHPLGPPCYSERVIPELCARIEDWLDADENATPQHKVVISAHSLGGVLAVACLFARQAEGKDVTNIGLLTYGCQLRAYFGRFFPELFGPSVLGTRGSKGASLWTRDPWQEQVNRDFSSPAGNTEPDPSQSLSQLLTAQGEDLPRWINLWRRTDFIGFPVKAYNQNEIDRGADELDASSYMLTLATHSDYPSSRAYPPAMLELLKRMGEPDP